MMSWGHKTSTIVLEMFMGINLCDFPVIFSTINAIVSTESQTRIMTIKL